MRNLYIITLLCLALLTPYCGRAAEPLRQSITLNDDWRFFWAAEADIDDAEYVVIPHVWDEDDRANMANYIRELYVPKEWANRRLFLRFGGAQSVVSLFVNEAYVGEHRGSYTAFTFEITDYVKAGDKNILRLIVEGGVRSDVLPVSTDQNIYGGIYRDVELLVTSNNAISPLHYSSDGVFVEQKIVDKERVEGVVRLYLSANEKEHLSLNLTIRDSRGREVVSRNERVAKVGERGVELPFVVNKPELWSPASPALYSFELTLLAGGEEQDRVTVTTGFRRVTVSNDNRLCINGEPVEVRGVGLAHDRRGLGSALTMSHLCEDFERITDVGANALRSLNGPHDSALYELCDREGMLVWVDMPFTRSSYSFADVCFYPNLLFRDNGFEQLREIIAQNYNHPSIMMWGLFSLVWQRGDAIIEYIKMLNTLAHQLDSSRPTVGCSNVDGPINFITDLIVLRQNVGWSKGSPNDVNVWCRQLSANEAWQPLRYGVCYGEEGVMGHQSESMMRAKRHTRHLPERRQTYMHECYADILCGSGIFWGVWVESLFDYGSERRVYGVNNCGLVDYGHSEAKDAYYLYRAKWNADKPTLYITNRRWTERRDTLQHIDIYSSVGEPTLLCGEDTLPLRQVADVQWRADSVVLRGSVELRATDSLGVMQDRVRFRVVNDAESL